MKKILLLVIITSFFFASCLKQNAMKEVEDQRILNYIFDIGLDFDTTSSGAIFHKTYIGEGDFFSKNDIVPLIYTGFISTIRVKKYILPKMTLLISSSETEI